MDVDLVGSLAEAVPSDPLLAQLRSTSLFEVNPYCVDTAHHANLRGTPRRRPLADDLVRAYCECGTHELSRAEMQRAINAHQHTILLT